MDLSDKELSNEDSDSDWHEKYSARKNTSIAGGARGARNNLIHRNFSGSSGGVNKKLTERNSFQDNHVQALASSRTRQVPVSENDDSIPAQPLNSTTAQCCSCSQSSGCKTKKCGCKAMGGLCGNLCGCNSERCANRGEPVSPAGSNHTTSSPENEFQAQIPTTFDSALMEQSPAREGGERRLSFVGILGEVEAGARRAERAMAVERAAMAAQAAALLDNAWKEGGSPLRENPFGEGHLGSGEDSEQEVEKRIPRRPLSDLGNTKVCNLFKFDGKLLCYFNLFVDILFLLDSYCSIFHCRMLFYFVECHLKRNAGKEIRCLVLLP